MSIVLIVSGSTWAAITLSSSPSSRPSFVIFMDPTAPASDTTALEGALRQAPVVRWYRVTRSQPTSGPVIEADGLNLLPCYRPDCSASPPPLPETVLGVKVTSPGAVPGLAMFLENQPGVVAVTTRTES
jgi:hypothetical protein